MRWFLGGLIGVVLVCTAAAAQADVIGDVENNAYQFLVKTDLNPSDPYESGALAWLEDLVDRLLGLYDPAGFFTDMQYDSTENEWAWVFHPWRLTWLAVAYLTPGTPYYHDASLVEKLNVSLEFVNAHLYNRTNWYYHSAQALHAPEKYGRLLLVLNKGQIPISPAVLSKAESVLDQTFEGYLNPPGGHDLGANALWKATIHVFYAIHKRDPAYIAAADAKARQFLSIMDTSLTADSDGGIKPDYSFKMHGGCPLTGLYGVEFHGTVGGEYARAVAGTSYALPASKIQNMADYIAEGVVWKIYRGYWDPAVGGRAITRPYWNISHALRTMANWGSLANTRRAEIAQAFKEMAASKTTGFMPTYARWAGDLAASPEPAGQPLGHRHYPWADHTVHRSDDWFASLKMYSNKVRSFEPYDDENKKSWHRSAGWLYVVLDGGEYFGNDVMAAFDWNSIPGTTIEKRTYANWDGNMELGARTFVGGAHADGHGVSAMDYDASGSNHVTAKKSWFFFDDEIVALGGDIDCNTSYATHTIVNQWPLSSPTAPLFVDNTQELTALGESTAFNDPSWAHCDGMGYYFPGNQAVRGSRQNQSGRWCDIGKSGLDPTVHTKPFLTLWFDHGTNASNQTYAYAILPRKTKAEMEAYAAGSPITVLAHDNTVHAVRDNHLDAVGAVFWSSSGGSAGKVSADKDCLVYYRATADGFTLALSDPNFHADTITVTVDEPLEPVDLPAGVSAAVVGSTTEVVFQVDKGENAIARFSRTSGSSDVLASSYEYPNTPGNTVDGDLETRWSAEGDGEWIRYDLGEVKEVSAVRIAWYKGDERTSRFDVDVSSDDSNWTTVLADAESSGTTLGLETYDFADAAARYVRILGHGNSTSMWNSITEVEIVLATEDPCVDTDGDGYGSPASGACPHPELDCNDGDPGVNPGAVETCNQVDDDCDGTTDEGCDCIDGEVRPCGTDVGACEPGTQSCQEGVWSECEGGVNPADEVCGDELDNDCDGQTDEGCDPSDPDPVISGGCGCGVSTPGISLGGLLALVALAFMLRRRRCAGRLP
jgi:hyaluronate lyase